MMGNIGDLFVKYMRQVTKDQLYHLLGYQVTVYFIGRGLSQFCETSVKVIKCVIDPFR